MPVIRAMQCLYKSDCILVLSHIHNKKKNGESSILVITGSALEEMYPYGIKVAEMQMRFCHLCSLSAIKADPHPVGRMALKRFYRLESKHFPTAQ